MDHLQGNPCEIHPVRRLAQGLSPLLRIANLAETQLQLLKGSLFPPLVQRVLVLFSKTGHYLPEANDPGQPEEAYDEEQNDAEHDQRTEALPHHHEQSETGRHKGRGINDQDGMSLRESQFQQTMMEMAAIGGKKGSSLQKTPQHGEQRVKDRDA